MRDTEIRGLKADLLDLPLTEPFRIASGVQPSAQNVLVRLELGDGTAGLGEAAPVAHISGEDRPGAIATINAAYAQLIGQNARGWRRLAQELRAAHPHHGAARAGIEMALLDALTRHYRVPLRVLFGGGRVPLVTDMTITAGDCAHAARSARKIHERGIRAAKVKVGADTVDGDVARLAAIHAAVPQMQLIVDANGCHQLATATEFLEALAAQDIHVALYEQPLPRADHENWHRLAEVARVPLCADESARSASDVVELARRRYVTHINIKPMKAGIVEAWAMWQVAMTNGLGLMIGGMVESILAMTASAHLASGLGGFEFADLDTPMIITDHPFRGGFRQERDELHIDHIDCGHGVTLA